MDLDFLKSEATRLARPARLLSKEGPGAPAGWAYYREPAHVVLSLARADGFLVVSADGTGGGLATVEKSAPPGGFPLYANRFTSLPPTEALFLLGGSAVADWLATHRWEREWGYNENFGGRDLVRAY